MFTLDYDKNSSKIDDDPWHNLDIAGSLLRFTWSCECIVSVK